MLGKGKGMCRAGLAAAALAVLLGGYGACGHVSRAVAATPAPSATEDAAEESVAHVVVDGVELFPVRGVSAFPADRRAERVAARIRAIAADPAVGIGSLKVEESEIGSRITADGREIVTILDADAQLARLDRRTLAAAYAERIGEAIEAYRADRAPRYLLTSAAYALVATLALVAFLWVLGRAMRRIESALERRTKSRLAMLEAHSRRFVRAAAVWRVFQGLGHVGWAAAALAAVVVYLEFVLHRFPWTRLFGRRLLSLVLEPLRTMGEGLVAVIPDLIFLVILLLVTGYILKSIHLFFAGLAQGTIALANFEPEWA